MIRWIADDKNCEPRKKTSLKSVVRKSQVTGDVCPENIHPRSLLIARSNIHTYTHIPFPPKVHDPFHDRWPVFSRTFTYVRVEGISTDEYRRCNSKLSSNIKHLSNWCGQEGASQRRDVWGRPMYEFHGGPTPREMELRVLAEILCLSLARNIRALSPKRYGKRNPIAESTVNYIVPRE